MRFTLIVLVQKLVQDKQSSPLSSAAGFLAFFLFETCPKLSVCKLRFVASFDKEYLFGWLVHPTTVVRNVQKVNPLEHYP